MSDWHPMDDMQVGEWWVLDYPEYRVFGKVESPSKVTRLGDNTLILAPAYEVGLDKHSGTDPFRSPAMGDCRPTRRRGISSEGLRAWSRCEDRWQEWPGKDD